LEVWVGVRVNVRIMPTLELPHPLLAGNDCGVSDVRVFREIFSNILSLYAESTLCPRKNGPLSML